MEPRHPSERATGICYFFLKNEVEKILEVRGQQTVKTCFYLACRPGKEDEKARLSGVSNLFKFEISAKISPVLDRCFPKKERDRRELKRNWDRMRKP